MPQSPLNAAEQQKLLSWARKTIEAAVRGLTTFRVPEAELTPNLRAPHGVFVTLTKSDQLRGCIGHMDFSRPLLENCMHSAKSSALEDPRFPPVEPSELLGLRLEISVLEPPRPIQSVEEFDHLRHGIIISKGGRHGLFLPQVASEQGWDKQKTLEMVCWKAGLPPDAWREPDARFEVFTAFVFGKQDGSPPT
jgi:AmmeMemoRadiSam system protein A